MTIKDWKRLLGYEPCLEQKKIILQAVQDEGISIAEACARMAMPPVFIQGLNEPNPDEYNNPFRPAIYIKTRGNNDKQI